MEMDRRRFLGAGAGLVAGVFLTPSLGLASDFWSQPRHLWLRRATASGKFEEFRGVYFADGQVVWSSYVKICQLLRDVRANKTVQMSPVLLDILCGIQGVLAARGIAPEPLITHSGYRTVATNQAIEGAARASLHTQGRAWDGRAPALATGELAKTAQYLRGGGVGIYIDRGFCHVDDGRLRSWRG